MQAMLLKNGIIKLSTGGVLNPGDEHYPLLAAFLRQPLLFSEDQWAPYQGAYGGRGWRNLSNGSIVYQDAKPVTRTSTGPGLGVTTKPNAIAAAIGTTKTASTEQPPQARAFQVAKQFLVKHKSRVTAMINRVPVIRTVTQKTGQIMVGIKRKLAQRYGDKAASLILASGSISGYAVSAAAVASLGWTLPGLGDAIGIAVHTAIAETLLQAGVIGKNITAHAEDLADADISQLGKQAWQELTKRVAKMIAEHKDEIESAVSALKAKGQTTKENPEHFSESKFVEIKFNNETGNVHTEIPVGHPDHAAFSRAIEAAERERNESFAESTCGPNCTCDKCAPAGTTCFAESGTCVSCVCNRDSRNQSGHDDSCPCHKAWVTWNFTPASEPAPDTGRELVRLDETQPAVTHIPEVMQQTAPQPIIHVHLPEQKIEPIINITVEAAPPRTITKSATKDCNGKVTITEVQT